MEMNVVAVIEMIKLAKEMKKLEVDALLKHKTQSRRNISYIFHI